MVNTETRRTVSIETTNNESHEDITIQLPSVSGKLITEQSFTTDTGIVATPFIITPISGTENYRGKFTTTPPEIAEGYTKGHTHTLWEVARDKNFETVVYRKKANKLDNKGDLCSTWLHDAGMGAFFVRCKHIAGEWQSGWSQPVYVSMTMPAIHNITTPVKVIQDPEASTFVPPTGIKRILDKYGGCYYGIIEHADLDDTYEYKGDFEEIKEVYVKENYEQQDQAKAMIKSPRGSQYWYRGELYYALEDMEPNEKEDMITPSSDPTKWRIEDRTKLPTPRLVADILGMGWGYSDANRDASNINTGSVTKIGELQNHESGYIMYSYKGKLCFTTPKPICSSISWTDLARRDWVYNLQTRRFGKYLYYVRMMYEDEYKQLFTRLQDGSYDTRPADDFGLDKPEWVYDTQNTINRRAVSCNFPVEPAPNKDKPSIAYVDMPEIKTKLILNNHVTDMMVEQIYTLNVSTSAGTWSVESDSPEVLKVAVDDDVRKLYALKEGTATITIKAQEEDKGERQITFEVTVTPKVVLPVGIDTNGTVRQDRAFRFVLEYVEEGCAPYNNLGHIYGDKFNLPENMEFKYDRASDTGYFGISKAQAFIDGNLLWQKLGVNEGVTGDVFTDWAVCYYHGMLVNIPLGFPKKQVYINQQWAKPSLRYGYHMCSVGSKTITIEGHNYWCMHMSVYRQVPYNQAQFASMASNRNKIQVPYVLKDFYRNTMFGELWLRLGDHYTGYQEVVGTTFKDNLLQELIGYQKGSSFVNISTRTLRVNGNGWFIGKEHSQDHSSSNYVSVNCYRSKGASFTGYNKDKNNDNNSCWKPVLVTIPKSLRTLDGTYLTTL